MPDDRVARLADELIPASDGLPPASEADSAGKWLDRFGRAHDVPNLFVVDGSVFVTLIAAVRLQVVPA